MEPLCIDTSKLKKEWGLKAGADSKGDFALLGVAVALRTFGLGDQDGSIYATIDPLEKKKKNRTNKIDFLSLIA